MNRNQKIAMFSVVVILLSILASAGAVALLAKKWGFPQALTGLCLLGLIGFSGMGSSLFRKPKETVDYDERDEMIHKKAAKAGFNISYGFFVAACMAAHSIVGTKGYVPAYVLPLIVAGGFTTVFLVGSIVKLIEYSRVPNHDDE